MTQHDDNHNEIEEQPSGIAPEDGGQAPDGSTPTGSPDFSPEGKPYRGLKTRTITALVLAVFYCAGIVTSIYVNRMFYNIFVLILMLFAGHEISNAITKRFTRPVKWVIFAYILIGFVVFMVVTHVMGSGKGGITAFFGVFALMFIVCIIYCMASKKHNMSHVVSTLFVMIYPCTIMVYLLSLGYLGVSEPWGAFEHPASLAVILAFVGSAVSDGAAYFVGSAVRGPKLCPSISPNKTISGAIGGLLGGMAAGLALMGLSYTGILGLKPLFSHIGLNIVNYTLLGLGTSVFCQIGDLVSSYIKRACAIKDFGKILPGHGGFMDRIDGVIIAGIFNFIYLFVYTVIVL